MDPELNVSCSPSEALRCMHIGLLCIQDNAAYRPTMLDVVSFLSNDTIQLAQPKQPLAFFNVVMKDSEFADKRGEICSLNDVSISAMLGR